MAKINYNNKKKKKYNKKKKKKEALTMPFCTFVDTKMRCDST